MKHFFSLAAFVLTSLVFIGGNCNKNDIKPCVAVEPSAEEAAIVAFITAKGISAVKHTSGMYYQITNPGTGATPTATSNVRCQYTGRLIDSSGTVFDSNNTLSGASFNLGGVIQGWTIGIPLIKSGGSIRLIIPSKYAYSCAGSAPTIPANSVLDFSINLLSVF